MVLYIGTEKSVCATSSVDRVPGYEPVGRRFESCVARHETRENASFHGFLLFLRLHQDGYGDPQHEQAEEKTD